jgi:hypothetical protein
MLNYTYTTLNNIIQKYLKLGEVKAGLQASKFIEKLHFENKIEEIDLETYLIKFVADNLVELIEEDINLANFNTKQLLEYVELKENNYILYISNFTKFIDILFKNRLDDSKLKTAQYKKTILPQILFDVDNYVDVTKVKKIKGKSKRVTKVDIRDLYYKYLITTKTIELNNAILKFANLEDLATQINTILKDMLVDNIDTNDIKETLNLWGLGRIFDYIIEDDKLVSVVYNISSSNVSNIPF